ncbi:MAG: ABC transporter ATP-binding protein [Myxococcales bacterium]|nr:ABC transporter ATP-binding protein [Myxococcales bacterium]
MGFSAELAFSRVGSRATNAPTCYGPLALTTPLLQLTDVAKSFGYFRALHGVSFELEEAQVFGYIGPNGAGKTTTLKILAGLLHEFQGTVHIAGKQVPEHRGAVQDLIGFLPQNAGFQQWRTSESALRSLGLLSGVEPEGLDKRITMWLERFGLEDKRNEKIKKLSGGTVQKLGLIQALLHRPKLLILDEPLAGLDPISRNEVKALVRECRARSTSVLFSSHILSDVEDVADSVGILHGGRLVKSGTIEALKDELPVDIEIEFSVVPQLSVPLHEHQAVESLGRTTEQSSVLRIKDGADVDDVLHSFVEQTLASGGRIRQIGIVKPDLNGLYAQYIHKAEEQQKSARAQ